jgi:uncharacterized protein YuzB (UPF0349 family)
VDAACIQWIYWKLDAGYSKLMANCCSHKEGTDESQESVSMDTNFGVVAYECVQHAATCRAATTYRYANVNPTGSNTVTTNSHAHANSTDSDLYATTYRASGSTSDR